MLGEKQVFAVGSLFSRYYQYINYGRCMEGSQHLLNVMQNRLHDGAVIQFESPLTVIFINKLFDGLKHRNQTTDSMALHNVGGEVSFAEVSGFGVFGKFNGTYVLHFPPVLHRS
jgi:hypothetical protein